MSYQILLYNDYMPTRLSIQAHLGVDELATRYRRAKDPVARSHWQVIWLLAQGLRSAQVAAVTGYTANWVRTLARRYNQRGPAGLGDRRHRHPGAAGLLSTAQRAALAAALTHLPPDGGVGTGPKAAAWMSALLGHAVHPQRGWEALRRLGWTSKVPRPRHAKADPTAQMAFKKTSRP
jgi:transposase